MTRVRVVVPLLTAAMGVAFAVATAAPAAAAGAPVVLHSAVVTQQDVAPQPGSEPDTVTEPDVAVSPVNPDVAIAAAHDSRYPDGGAVDISVAWTSDGGASWQHRAVPGITKAVGGRYLRASDPVVAFDASGTAYLSVLLFDQPGCATAVAVLRSGDGGRTWTRPFYAHQSSSCDYSDDKNWIVVDTSPTSPHFGRVYQFWTPFRYRGSDYLGSPQAVRWSDDRAQTWSATSYITPLNHGAQNSQPMILPDGTVVDTFYDDGPGQLAPDVTSGNIDPTGTIYAASSTDGGATWSAEHEVVNNAGGYAQGVRCCLFAADIDATTHRMHVAWEGGVADTDPVYEAFSTDGVRWSSPVPVSRGDVSGVQRVNVDVVARGGTVYVSYGTRTDPGADGGFVRQQLSVSTDGGRSFGAPTSIGPVSNLKYAARAEGYFPGDYIGSAMAPGRLYVVWSVSSKPPATSPWKYHQVIWGVTLDTHGT